MAKQNRNKEERLIYCSGPGWEGDGTKDSSPCKFNKSIISTAERFKCPYCCVGLSPSGIHADKNGVIHRLKELNMPTKKAPEHNENTTEETVELAVEEVVESTEETVEPAVVDESEYGSDGEEAAMPEEAVETPETEEAPKVTSKKKVTKKHRRRRF